MTTPLTREERERIEAEAHKWAEERLSLLPQDELNARLRLTLGNVFALLSTIDSLEAQVKEAEAQRDNDRRAVRSLERVKDENATLREALALADELAKAAVVRRPSAFWGTMTLQEPIDGESDFTLIAEADLDRLKSARLAYRSIREGKNALVGLRSKQPNAIASDQSLGRDNPPASPTDGTEK